MKKLQFFVSKITLVGVSLLLLMMSCTKGYNLNDRTFDETVTIGGENLSFPIGNMKPITIPNILGGVYSISFKDTSYVEAATGEVICDLLRYNDLEIKGTFESTFPYPLIVSVSFLDTNKMDLGLTSSEQTINPCLNDGSPDTSDLDITIKKKEGIRSVGALVFNVSFIADGEREVVLPYHSYIKADNMFVKIPGGFTFE